MVSCSTFISELECALHYTNEFNVKLILLLFIMSFILVSIYISRKWEFKEMQKSGFKSIIYMMFKAVPRVLLFFSPFFLIMLRNTVELELVIESLVVFYYIYTGLFIGLGIFYFKDLATDILGDRRDFINTMKKR